MRQIGMLAVVAILCAGCFTDSIFQKLGVTQDFAMQTAIQYAQKTIKEKNLEQYVTADEVETIAKSAVKALEADTEFQTVMTGIAAKQATQALIEANVKKIIDEGVALPK